MGEGRFEIGQKERNQLKVLREGRERQMTQQQAAEQLGLTERPVRRLMARMRTVEIDLWCTACVAQDSTVGNRQCLELHGRPLEFYTDEASLFEVASKL